MTVASSVIGISQGRVTGRVSPGTVAEITLQIRGGSDAFYAYASNGKVDAATV